MMGKIGLIAGSDYLPLVFAEEAGKQNEEVVAVAFRGYTLPEIEKRAKTYWLENVHVSEVLKIIRQEGLSRIVMEGKMPQSMVFSTHNLDSEAISLIEGAENCQGRTILGKAADLLETLGIEVLDARTYLDGILCEESVLTRRKPDRREWTDVMFGFEILKKITSENIGQCVVVRNRVVLAVEAAEGTDGAISRGGMLGGEKVVVAKMAGPYRDMRFDVPVIGLKTVEIMSECGAAVLAVEAGKTFIMDREETIRFADERSIAIAGVKV